MHRENLPASWCSTANYSEALAFHAADTLLVIDDFKPGGSSGDIQRAHFQADRIFRGAGNRAGRGRMRSDGSLQLEKPPRAFIVSTGEEVPHGHSLRARLVVLELAPGDVRWDHLTTCQQLASNGVFASTMAAFIQWLAPKMPVQIPPLIESLRPQLSGAGGLHRTGPQ